MTTPNAYLFGKCVQHNGANGVMLSYNPDAQRVYVTWEQNIASGWYSLDELEMYSAADNPKLQGMQIQLEALEKAHGDMAVAIAIISKLLERLNSNDNA